MSTIGSRMLLGFFIAYFLLAFVHRSWLVWRRTGVNPYSLPRTDDAYGLVTTGFRLVILVVMMYLLVQAFNPAVIAHLGIMEWLAVPALRLAGWGGLFVSLVWLLIAQAQMGTSWRIGIDQNHETRLVTDGLFRISRNPIFLAMRLNLFCLFLIQPNGLTLSVWVLGDFLMQFQVRLEEVFLSEQHGEEYRAYIGQVRRWL